MVSYQNCSKIQATDMDPVADLASTGDDDLPQNPGDVICDPLGGAGSGDPRQGLIGQLHYLTSGMPRYGNVRSYFDNGVRSEPFLYMNQINIPTVRFSHGFTTQGGDKVKTNEGDVLTEFFAIRFRSLLKLPPGMPPGDYQLAVLSDDGARVYIQDVQDTAGAMRLVVDNDGTHSTRLGCALNQNQKVRMTENSRASLALEYYQGPRDEIALMLLWRKWEPNSGFHDLYCGHEGSSSFFDWSVFPSVPKTKFLTLLDKGWSVIPPEAFELPSGATNPCNQ